MKTHLPVALRKALLAALVAVSAFAYNQANAVEVKTSVQNATLNAADAENGVITIDIVKDDTAGVLNSLEVDYAEGSLQVNTTDAAIHNADINVGGNVTFGDDTADAHAKVLNIRGMGDTVIKTGGDLVVNQTVLLGPGVDQSDGNTLTGMTEVEVGKSIKFNGDTTKIQGGSAENSATVLAEEGISINSASGITVGNSASVTTKNGDFTMDAGNSLLEIAGKLYAENGNITANAENVMINQNNGRVTISASENVHMTAQGVNSAANADISGDNVQMKGVETGLYFSTVKNAGKAVIFGSDSTTMHDSTVSESGEVVIGQTDAASDGTGGTEIESSGIYASDNVTVGGSSVSVTKNKGISTTGGDVSITATGADTTDVPVALYVQGGYVEASGDVEMLADTGSAKVKGVSVDGDDVTIKGKASTVVADVSVDASTIALGDADSETTVKMDSSLEADNDISVTGTTTKVVGGTVESKSGHVSITGSELAAVESSVVSGNQVDITGKNTVVSGKSVTGLETVTIAGTDSTTVDAVQVKGSSVTVGERGSTVVKHGTSLEATDDINVTGDSVKVAQSAIDSSVGNVSIKADGADTDTPALYVHGSAIESSDKVELVAETGSTKVKDTSIEGGGVTLRGESSTTVANVQVDSSTINVGNADSETTVKMGSELEASGRVDITGSTAKIVSSSVESEQGEVAISASETALLSGATVSGDNVAINGGDIKINNATSVEADKGSIVAVADSLTVGTTGATVAEDYLTARKEVSITVSDAATIQGAAQVEAKGGAVTFAGGKTATNTITGTGTLVEASGNVDMAGAKNAIESGAKVDAGANVNMLAADTDDAATATNTISAATVEAEGNVSLKGAANTISAAAQVKAESGAVTLAGETNSITGTGTLVDAAGNVDMSGATNTIESGAKVDAGANVNMLASDTDDAATATNTISAATVEAEGNVSLLGEANTITDAATVTAEDGAVALSGDENTISAAAQVKAKEGAVTLAGETNTITGTGTLVEASGNVDMSGAMNTIESGAKVDAGANVNMLATDTDDAATATNTISAATVEAEGNVSLKGEANTITDAAAVTAEAGSVALSAGYNMVTDSASLAAEENITLVSDSAAVDHGNLVDAASLTATNGDISLQAARTNKVDNGATLNASAGSVTLKGDFANIVSGSTTKVSAGDGPVLLESAVNLVDAAKLDAAGADGTVAVTGLSNVIRNAAEVQADAGISIDSTGTGTGSGNVINASSVQTTGGNVAITAAKVNHVDAGKLQAGSGTVALSGESNVISNTSEILGGGDVSIVSTGTDAAAGNVIAASGLESTSGDVSITAANINLMDKTVVTADAGEAFISGSSNVVRNESSLSVGTGITVDSTGTGEKSGNQIADSTVETATGDVEITAERHNHVTEASAVAAGKGSVNLDGDTNTLDAASQVTAGKYVNITADTQNNILSGSDVKAGISVNMTGPINTISGSGTDTSEVTAVAGNVIVTGETANSIGDYATVQSRGAAVVVKGGDTALNTISGANALVKAGSSVYVQGKNNTVEQGADLQAGTNASLVAEELNTLTGEGTTVQAGVSIGLAAGSNLVTEGAALSAGENITLVSDNVAEDHGNLVDAASLTATNGDISLQAARTNKVDNGATLNASAGSVTLKGGFANIVSGSTTKVTAGDGAVSLESAVNLVDAAKLDAAGAGGTVAIAGQSNVIRNAADVQADAGISIDSTGTGSGSGNVINSSTVQSSDGDVNIAAANINHVDKGTVKADSGAVAIEGLSNAIGNESVIQAGTGVDITSEGTDASAGNVLAGSTVQAVDGDVNITAANINAVDETEVNAGTGSVAISGASNVVRNESSVVADEGVEITSDGTGENAGNLVSDSSVQAKSGDVELTAENHNHVTAAATVKADAGSVNITGIGNTIDKASQVVASENVTIAGDNSISSESQSAPRTSIIATTGDISISDSNDIKYATIDAQGAEGDVYITTGAGKGTIIEDSEITGETVTISGDSRGSLAEVKGENMLVESRGEDAGAGITLNNVSVQNTGKGAADIAAMNGGNIIVENRVDVLNGTLTIIESSASGAYDAAAGRILVEDGNVLNMKAASSLAGHLSGSGCINKSGGDELLLDYDHTGFAGTIYANGATGGPEGSVADAGNAGSWIKVTDAGVGAAAKMVLRNTDLVIGTSETLIGSLDTTQDAEANKAATGGTLLADGSYTADDNTRVDFATVGSVVEVNKGISGDVVRVADMKLSDATLLKLDATVDADGNAVADRIEASGSINAAAATGLNVTSTAAAPSTARVYINHTDVAAAANAAEGARTTIMTGRMAADINEDVLYDVEKSANGTYQRVLQDRNVHLENKGDSVDMVFSKNYRSAARTEQMQQVANALSEVSDAFHHSEGWLAASNDPMAKLLDAFDYTRSEGAAQRGLQSVAGTGNVLPQLIVFDSSRHHLNNLRRQMEMPVCPRTWKGAANRKTNAWMTYTGAHDRLGGDAYLGDYSRTAHGTLLGVDTSLSCKLRVGLSLGYEYSSASADSSRVDADTFFADAYATAYTGHIKHRASIGVATTSFDSRRGVSVDAGYHSFHGTGHGETDALTLNFGYEISSDYRLNACSWLTRYAALNLAWHDLDSMREEGMGTAGLVTEYDSEWQADVSLGVAYNREFAAVKYEAPAVFYANAAVHVDLMTDRASAENRFEGADAGWKVHGLEREPLYVELGAGVMVPLSPAWTATAGAAAEIGPDRTSFSGNIGARYHF